jgi:hypothetical protein
MRCGRVNAAPWLDGLSVAAMPSIIHARRQMREPAVGAVGRGDGRSQNSHAAPRGAGPSQRANSARGDAAHQVFAAATEVVPFGS